MQEHGRWCVGAHIQAFTFSSQDHGRLSIVHCVCVCVCVVCVCVDMVVRMCMCMCMCGVWCGVVLFCVVWLLGMRKNPPCVDSKRLRECVQDASVCTGKTPACVGHAGVPRYTRKRFESTHGGFFRLLCLSCSLSVFLALSSLSATMTMITCPVGSLCVHTALTSQSVGLRVLWLIFPVGRTCSHHARNNCPGFTMQASRHNLCWKWVMC